ncbi:MAG TPA: alkaline phosphatase family protein, partial [Streptosporangiaceae bacterium]|nr:alkaline phosphatase family protein [Streptosporangiaceae bacterium]
NGCRLPFHLDMLTTSAQSIPSTSHAYTVQHSAWNGGKKDNWLPAHLAADGKNGPFTVGYHTRDDIPFQFALAESFTILDNYHCSVLGPTWPNRLYHLSADIDPAGTNGGPIISNIDPVARTWKTYPEALTAAGVGWQVYQEVDNFGCNLLEPFAAFQNAPVKSTLFQSGMRTFSRGAYPQDVAITPNGHQVYATVTGGDTGPGGSSVVAVINVSTDAMASDIKVGADPRQVALSPDGSRAYVTTETSIAVIDTASGKVVKTIADRSGPQGIAVSPDGKALYVTNPGAGQLLVLNAATGQTKAVIMPEAGGAGR